jgi:hypothetical protein
MPRIEIKLFYWIASLVDLQGWDNNLTPTFPH